MPLLAVVLLAFDGVLCFQLPSATSASRPDGLPPGPSGAAHTSDGPYRGQQKKMTSFREFSGGFSGAAGTLFCAAAILGTSRENIEQYPAKLDQFDGAHRLAGQARAEVRCLRIGRGPQRTRGTGERHRRPGSFAPWRRCVTSSMAADGPASPFAARLATTRINPGQMVQSGRKLLYYPSQEKPRRSPAPAGQCRLND